MGGMEKSAGLLLIVIALLIFFFSMGSLTTALSTEENSTLENLTAQQKQIVGINSYLILFIPAMLLIGGMALVWKG